MTVQTLSISTKHKIEGKRSALSRLHPFLADQKTAIISKFSKRIIYLKKSSTKPLTKHVAKTITCGEACDELFNKRKSHVTTKNARSMPKAWSIMAFCACMRFSAWGKTIEYGASITSSVTSTPLSAGKQCMKKAFLPAIFIRFTSTCNKVGADYKLWFNALDNYNHNSC